ncbi:MAG: CoA transferase [Proteobacteria bacterium]|nr:CoA transferase [Pseudomonadota bacterium]
MTDNQKKPLEGVRVLEFCQIAAGPFAGSLLADLGADVVKVERPDGGDGLRHWPPLTRGETGEVCGENFASINRNKRSITADLKNADDVERLRNLCEACDVLIENFRPGVLSRHGLGYPELKIKNKRLVYCSLTGFGQSGPYASHGAFDVTVQAASGVMSVTGEPGGGPVKCGVPFGDFCAGLYAAYCILASVMRVRETGNGAYIDCSMIGSLIGVSALQTSEYFGTKSAPKKFGSAHPRNAPYQAFRGSDRFFVIAAGTNKFWLEVCKAVGKPEIADDPRFSSVGARAKNQQELVRILEPLFAAQTADHWLAEMIDRGVPCSPIKNYQEVLSDPQIEHMNIIKDLVLSNGETTQTTAFPISISDFDFEIYRPPPRLGEHTEEVFQDWLGDQ